METAIHRSGLRKQLSLLFVDRVLQVGNVLKDLEGEGSVPRDDRHREEKKIQKLTDDFVKQIDETVSQKEEEILQV